MLIGKGNPFFFNASLMIKVFILQLSGFQINENYLNCRILKRPLFSSVDEVMCGNETNLLACWHTVVEAVHHTFLTFICRLISLPRPFSSSTLDPRPPQRKWSFPKS